MSGGEWQVRVRTKDGEDRVSAVHEDRSPLLTKEEARQWVSFGLRFNVRYALNINTNQTMWMENGQIVIRESENASEGEWW